MKAYDKPQFSTKWWTLEKPSEIKGADLEKALASVEKALAEEKKKSDGPSIDACLAALKEVDSAVDKTVKKECDKKKHKDMITVLEKFHDRIKAETVRLNGAKTEQSAASGGREEDEEDENKLFDKEYLYKMIKHMKSGGTELRFGFGLNPQTPESSQLVLARKGKPERLFKALKNTGNYSNRLLTFGYTLRDAENGKTLVFRLEESAGEPPQVIKLGRRFLRNDNKLYFRKLKLILPGGQVIEDIEPDTEEDPSATPDAGSGPLVFEGDGPKGADAPIVIIDEPDPPSAFSGRNFGAFKVSISRDKLPMSARALTVESYRQFLSMRNVKSGRGEASAADAEAFIRENRIPLIVVKGTETPYDIDPVRDVVPGSKQIAEQGYVWLDIIPLESGPESPEEIAKIEEQIRDLPADERERLFKLTDERFYASTQCPEGTKLSSPNDPLAETWRRQERDTFKRISEYMSLPEHIRRLFPLVSSDQGGVPLSFENLERIRQIADKLEMHFTPEQIAALAARADMPWGDSGHVWTEQDLRFAELTVAELIQTQFDEQNTGAGTISWTTGKFTGSRVADLQRSNYGEITSQPITAGERTSRALLDLEAAITFAKRAVLPAAVLEEDGGYAVYKLEEPPKKSELKIENIAAPTWMDDPNQTAVTNIIRQCAALLSTEGLVLENSDGSSRIQAGGAGHDPFAGPISAYGVGMSKLRTQKDFEEQYAHVLRDVALDAVEKAAETANSLEAQFALPKTKLDPEEQAALKSAVEALNAADKETLDSKKAYLAAREKEIALKTKYMIPTDAQRQEIAKAEAATAAARAHNKEMVASKPARYAAAAKDFPLALNLGDFSDRNAFMKLPPEEQIIAFRDHVRTAKGRVAIARDEIQNGAFDPWAHQNLTAAAADGLGLTGKQRKWAEARAKQAREDKEFWDTTETVVSIGVTVGATVTSGPLGAGLAAAALAIDAHDFVKTVEEHQHGNAIAGMSLDPYALKIIEPGDPPGKAEVVLSIVGIGFSAHDAVKLVDTLFAGSAKISMAAVSDLAEKDIIKAFDSIGLNASKDARLRAELLARWQRAFGSKRVKDILTDGMNPEDFDAAFHASDRNAATLVRRNDDGTYTMQVVVQDDLPPDEALEALEEELRHAEQVASGEWDQELALLNETALGSWPTKSPLERLPTLRAQLDMEIDVEQKIKRELQEQLARATEGEKSAINDRLLEVEAQIEAHLQKRAQIPEGLSGDEVPDWVAESPPPRLFSTKGSSTTASNNAAGEAYYRSKLIAEQSNLPLPPDDHEFYMKNGKPVLRRVKGAGDRGVKKLMLEDLGDGTYRLVEDTSGRLSPAERLEQLEKRYSKIQLPPKSPLAEAAKKFDLGPKQLAYVRSFQDALTDLRGFGVEIDDVLEGLENLSPVGFAKEFRRRVRARMLEAIEVHAKTDPEMAQELMEAFLTSFPDQKSTGAMFEAYRAANLPKYMETVPKAKNATELVDVKRRGDDLSSIVEIVKDGMGPRIKGRYLQEDKSSLTALDMDQAVDYDKALTAGKERTGKPSILVGPEGARQELKGVIYCFPNQEAAYEAETLILGNPAIKNKGYFNISYYENGQLKWL